MHSCLLSRMDMHSFGIIFCLQIFYVNGWQCPTNQVNRSSYIKTGEQAVIGFQTTLRNYHRTLVYSVTNHKGDNLYAATFYKNVFKSENVYLGSEFIGNAGIGNFTIKTAAVKQDDGGMYLLQYKEGTGVLSTLECLKLYILGKPKKATITQDNNNILGRDSRLTCNSLSTTYPTNHTLNLVYNWKVNNVTNPSNSNKYVYSTSRNQLTIKAVSKEDANTRFTCSASESGSSITGLSSYESDLLTFQVIYGPDADTTRLSPPNTQYTLNEGVTLPDITCSGECYPRCNYEWLKSGTTVNNRAVLSLGQLFKTDASIYTCEVTNSNSTTISEIRKQVTVNVIYGPDASTTSLTPTTTSYTSNEGSSLDTIRCSGNCYPACNYKWTKTGNNRFTPVNNGNLSLGSLQRDEAGTYTCTVINPTSKREQTKTVSIYVIFGPDASTTSLTPSTTSYTRNEESSLDTIRCSGDCYPTCNYKWTKTGNIRFTPVNNGNLSLGSLQRDEAGTYTCTVSNPTSKQEQTKTVSIYVIYGPDADSLKLNPSQSSYTENKGTSLNDITCSAACYPNCIYTWTKFGSQFIESDILSLGTLDKDKAATYTCTAYNPTTKHNISTSVIVHVRFGPTECRLNVTSQYNLTEGRSSSEMTCQAECYPECTYLWTNMSSSSSVGTNGKFQLINSKRYEAGTYKCLCENKPLVKRQSSFVVITIHYPPDVTVLQSTTNITEGNNLTLTCDAKGVPSVYRYNSLTQTWNGVPIPNTNSEKIGKPKYSSLYIPSLQLQDSGTYSCFVNNGVNATDSTSSVKIKVKGFPKVLTGLLTFIGKTGDETNVSIQFYSFPEIQDVIFKSSDDKVMKNDTTKKHIVSHHETVVKDKFYGKESVSAGSITFRVKF
ncbi:hemicentin-1-like [Ruditapes philippinarum]|uniref:hemicentin-1-like n=1 Tax=Ruditapes philippinarum TaxID=129788 RepID=UPI00295B3F5D|nr:hemicentin-1-like [Ruditapes philippinarum]